MKFPLFTECPVCESVCMIGEPHETVIVRGKHGKKRIVYIHDICLKPLPFEEDEYECGMMSDEL